MTNSSRKIRKVESVYRALKIVRGEINGNNPFFYELQKSHSWGHIAVKTPVLKFVETKGVEQFLNLHPERAGDKITYGEVVLDALLIYMEVKP
jgi:hypothetical protein